MVVVVVLPLLVLLVLLMLVLVLVVMLLLLMLAAAVATRPVVLGAVVAATRLAWVASTAVLRPLGSGRPRRPHDAGGRPDEARPPRGGEPVMVVVRVRLVVRVAAQPVELQEAAVVRISGAGTAGAVGGHESVSGRREGGEQHTVQDVVEGSPQKTFLGGIRGRHHGHNKKLMEEVVREQGRGVLTTTARHGERGVHLEGQCHGDRGGIDARGELRLDAGAAEGAGQGVRLAEPFPDAVRVPNRRAALR